MGLSLLPLPFRPFVRELERRIVLLFVIRQGVRAADRDFGSGGDGWIWKREVSGVLAESGVSSAVGVLGGCCRGVGRLLWKSRIVSFSISPTRLESGCYFNCRS